MKRQSLILVLLIPLFFSCSKKDSGSQVVEDADKFIGSYSFTLLGQHNTIIVTKLSSNRIHIEFPTGSELGFLNAEVSGRDLTLDERTVNINGISVTYSGTGNLSADGNTLTLNTNHITLVCTRG